MCNLNIFIKTNKGNLDLVSFLDSVTKNSYLGNPDGDGVYFNSDNTIIKSQDRLNYLTFMKNIKDSNFILSHQRIATSGLTAEYLQPFDNKEFCLLHNGVLSSFVKGGHSDTYVLFRKFNKAFKKISQKNKKLSREEKIIKTINKLLDSVSGTFSICLFDKTKQKMYYFKNDYTNIRVFRSEDKAECYLTTLNNNEKILDLYDNTFREVEIQDFKIYTFSINEDKIKILEIAEIKQDTSYLTRNYNTKKEKSYRDLTLEEIKDLNDISDYGGYKMDCSYCSNLTENFDLSGVSVCDDCLLTYFNGDFKGKNNFYEYC